MRKAQTVTTGHARNYGKLQPVTILLSEEQITRLNALATPTWPSVSEHIRRAIDAYLERNHR
jgi:predicted transcriptional regulator